MFETLLASNVAPRPEVRAGLAALFVHLAIVIGAISARATGPAAFKPAVRDTIRLDLSRPRVLEPQHSNHTPPSTGAAEITGPPVAPDVPPRIPALEPPRFTAAHHPAFSDAAREALWKARFTPARRAGRPVAMLVRQTIRFVTR